MKTIDDVRQAVAQFKKLIAPEYHDQIEISDPFFLLDCGTRKADWPGYYRDVWKRDPLHGVYMIFDASDKLLYVGKAVLIGKRLNDYFRNAEDKTKCKVVDKWLADSGATSVRVVILSHDEPQLHFLSPALEWSLIAQLNPPCNTQFRVAPPEIGPVDVV